MAASPPALELFAAPVRRWFSDRMGQPTEVQQLAWPHIAAGEHTLVTAPTGSGKTLTAFLWAIDRLLTGAWPVGQVQVLYVSPLKALGNDIRCNLLVPLTELAAQGQAAGEQLPQIRVLSRTGDTPADERRRMLRQPPEILVTTPESLNIMLTSRGGSGLLSQLSCVILDEVHAVVGSKRGVHLMTAVERLVLLSGEVQRIALSATVRPLERVARWVGGYQRQGPATAPVLRPRPVTVVEARQVKRYDLQVAYPVAGQGEQKDPDLLWERLVLQIRQSISRNRSTLIFGNSRRMVEKVARFLNADERQPLAYSHHGSLSRELRAVVEQRLKAGELRAIVATSSLELGIDIGSIDEVALVSSPGSVAAAVQRIGRAGHGVGQTSRARLYPLFPRDLLEGAVVARAVLEGDIEPVEPMTGPLDVLAQVLLSMTVRDSWPVEELLTAIRASDAYHDLPRRHFDLVLEMLAGRFASTRLRSLRPLVTLDRVDGTVRARPGADRLLYLAGGTIPDRGYYHLRLDDTGALLGELDEEFVWERSVGDTFTLGVQIWRIRRITHNDVMVVPAGARAAMAPFWRADQRDRSCFLSLRVAELLERAEPRLADKAFLEELEQQHRLAPAAARELRQLLQDQQAACGCLPHRHRVVIESCPATGSRGDHRQLILHTCWGGRVNRPLSLALAAAWRSRFGITPELSYDDDCVALTHPGELQVDDPFAVLRQESLETLLRQAVEQSGLFGARFREAAGCALLLPRAGRGRRVPLWVSRQRAKELLQAVADQPDFPLVLEAWRSCLQNDFELAELQQRLQEVAERRIELRRVVTDSPSPFAATVLWRQTNRLMYEDDTPLGSSGPRLHGDLLRELVASSQLRPRLDPAQVDGLVQKLQRLAPGYAPRTAADLTAWVGERLAIPAEQWQQLLAAMVRDHQVALPEVLAAVADRLLILELGEPLVCSVEILPRLLCATGRLLGEQRLQAIDQTGAAPTAALAALSRFTGSEPENGCNLGDLLSEWLRFFGPVAPAAIAATWALPQDRVDQALAELAEQQVVILGCFFADASDGAGDGAGSAAGSAARNAAGSAAREGAVEVCDRENLERLLRLMRAEARPVVQALPVDHLPLFLAAHQGLGGEQSELDDLQEALERLFGFPAPAEIWESELLPARLEPYSSSWLDTLLAETDLTWFGVGERRLSFCLAPDRELLTTADACPAEDQDEAAELFPQELGRYPFADLQRLSGLSSGELTRRLWSLAWQGRVSSDSFTPVRQGLGSGFKAASVAPQTGRGRGRRRAGFDRWRASRPFAGSWYLLPPPSPPADALEQEEQRREQVRLLLDRYGLLYRELLDRELPHLTWSSLFRSLRLLELAGEVVAGRFFAIESAGIQFMSHAAFRRLEQGLDEERIWWCNATDPASPCGLGLSGLAVELPRRVAGNHLVFHGSRLVVVSQARGKRLTISVAPDHDRLAEYLGFLRVLLGRAVQPMRSVEVETINGQPAAASPFRQVLNDLVQVSRAGQSLRLSRRYL